MQPLTAFAVSLALVGVLSLLVVLVLRKPLSELLDELCGNNRRARFWTVFVGLGIVLASIECALLVMPGSRAPMWDELQGLRVLLSVLRAGVLGLLLGFGALGFVLLVSIARYNEHERIRQLS